MNYNVYRGDDMNEDYLTIGELAQKMDVTVRTLQYYDREGLLKPAAISKGGRRLYSTKDIVKLHQILSFKYLGFSLVEIKTKLFNLDTPQEVAAILNQQKSVIQEQIANLSEAWEIKNIGCGNILIIQLLIILKNDLVMIQRPG